MTSPEPPVPTNPKMEATPTPRNSIHHSVKCWPDPFHKVRVGIKPFEIRVNDRDYREGDTITLKEYDPDAKMFSGLREGPFTIGPVISGWGLPEGTVVFGLLPESESAAAPSLPPVLPPHTFEEYREASDEAKRDGSVESACQFFEKMRTSSMENALGRTLAVEVRRLSHPPVLTGEVAEAMALIEEPGSSHGGVGHLPSCTDTKCHPCCPDEIQCGPVVKTPPVNLGPYSVEDLELWSPMVCGKCGWLGLSRDCLGGDPIPESGDYSDILCPCCMSGEIEDQPERAPTGATDTTRGEG